MPFGVHGPDLVIVLVIALLIFGPKKLPQMGASVGKTIQEFKKGMSELTAPKEEKPSAYEPVVATPVVANYTAEEHITPAYEPAPYEPEAVTHESSHVAPELQAKEAEANAQ